MFATIAQEKDLLSIKTKRPLNEYSNDFYSTYKGDKIYFSDFVMWLSSDKGKEFLREASDHLLPKKSFWQSFFNT